jgi:hypothetical protein
MAIQRIAWEQEENHNYFTSEVQNIIKKGKIDSKKMERQKQKLQTNFIKK